MIDPHVHLRDWNQRDKETLAHGLAVARSCGFDYVFDMPNTDPPLTGRRAIVRRLRDVEALGLSDSYGLYAGITDDAAQIAEVVGLVKEFPSVVGLKLFAGHSTGRMGIVDEERQRFVWRCLAAMGYKGVVAVHCEKEALLHPELDDLDRPASHSLARPPEAEVASIADQLAFSREAGFAGTLHVCHLSTVAGLDLVDKARREGRKVSCGVTAHHLLLSFEDAREPGLFARMNPPLRSDAERKALFSAVLQGRIDWIESDHAPHTIEDKRRGACGIPGFSGTLLLASRLRAAGCSESLLQRLLGQRVLNVFGLPDRPVSVPPSDVLLERSNTAAEAYPYDSYRLIREALAQ